MKVKRYGLLHLKDCDEWRMCEMAGSSGTHVLATDYDALMELARRLRGEVLFLCDGEGWTPKSSAKLLSDSAWLEE